MASLAGIIHLSGMNGLLQGKLSGPVWLSGGANGMEASLIGVVIALIVGIYLLRRVMQKGNILKPTWKRHSL
jgi:hypothetical protein